MNNIDLLMGLDAEKLAEVPTKELKILRLSQLTGNDFIVKVKALPAKRFTELTSGGVKEKDGSINTAKAYDINVKVALAGLVDPSMKDKDLQEKFGCSTPGQLFEKVFTGSEISAMADSITGLSGFSGNVVEEVKN